MKRTIVASFIAVLGITASGCEASGDGSEESAGGPGKPDVTVAAKKIIKEFENNEAAADGKYKDKTLRVSGVVDKVDTEILDEEQYVVRVGAGTQFDFITVNCNDQSSKDVTSIKKGRKITVVGEFDDGGDLGVELKNCQIR